MDIFGVPYWLPSEITQRFPELSGNKKDQIVIVGGSYAGLTAAYCLAKAGYSVSLLEADLVGEAASRAAGVVCSSLERDYLDYVNSYNVEIAQRLWKFSTEGVEFVQKLVKLLDPTNKSQLEHTGSLYLGYEDDREYLKQECAARNSAGFVSNCFENRKTPLSSDGANLGIFTPGDCVINPYTFCRVLLESAVGVGVTFYERSRVTRIDKEANTCYTTNGRIEYEKLLLAGQNVPGNFGFSPRELNILTFCLATEKLSASQINDLGLSGRASFWDTDQPFFYGRLSKENRLILGGDDLWKPMSVFGLQRIKLDRLERRAKERIPLLKDTAIEFRWGGPLTVLPDAMPSIGVENNIFIGGNSAGLSQAVMVGKILAGLVVDCHEDLTGLLSYKRKIDLIPRMYSSRELFHMVMSLAGIF